MQSFRKCHSRCAPHRKRTIEHQLQYNSRIFIRSCGNLCMSYNWLPNLFNMFVSTFFLIIRSGLKVNVKHCGLTLLQSYLFELSHVILEFYLLHSSEFYYWLVWRMRRPLRTRREMKTLTCFMFKADEA